MPQIILVAQAVENLKALHDFIAIERPQSAQAAVQAISNAINRLQAFPQLGIQHEEVANIRTLIIPFGKYGYRVIYRLSADQQIIEILTIKHHKQV